MTPEDLALACELRQSGCSWKAIAIGLGVHHIKLKNAVQYALKHGISRRAHG